MRPNLATMRTLEKAAMLYRAVAEGEVLIFNKSERRFYVTDARRIRNHADRLDDLRKELKGEKI